MHFGEEVAAAAASAGVCDAVAAVKLCPDLGQHLRDVAEPPCETLDRRPLDGVELLDVAHGVADLGQQKPALGARAGNRVVLDVGLQAERDDGGADHGLGLRNVEAGGLQLAGSYGGERDEPGADRRRCQAEGAHAGCVGYEHGVADGVG